MGNRKALLIGIDDYPGKNKLNGCVADVKSIKTVLEKNGDETPNFDIVEMLDVMSSHDAMVQIDSLFAADSDIALLYFCGHGFDNTTGSELVFPDDVFHARFKWYENGLVGLVPHIIDAVELDIFFLHKGHVDEWHSKCIDAE